jgi:hypothetical protein
VKARLWYQDTSKGDELVPLADLIAWFRESAQTFRASTSEGKVPPGVPPPSPELYWHGRNDRACPRAGCIAGGEVLLDDPVTQALTKGGQRRGLNA